MKASCWTNVFRGGEVTRLSSLKNRFYTAIPAIRQDIKSRLRNQGDVLARSRLGEWLQCVWHRSYRCSFFDVAISLEQTSLRLNRPVDWLRIYFCDYLVVVSRAR